MNTREDIYRLIEEEDVEFIRLQFTDVFGILKNIAVTPGQLERVMSGKYHFQGSAMYDDFFACSEDLYLLPDPDTFVILPWRPQQGKVAKMICDVCYMDGTPVEYNPRTILKKAIKEASDKGYSFKVNPECEFFLFHTDDYGNPTTVSHEKAGYLNVGPADFGENARRDMVLTLEDMGFEIESSHHEKAPAQHEIDFSESETLKAADDITTFRFAVRSIAKRFGLYATFMPKPRSEYAGSGMHLNFSLYKDGVNVFECNDSGCISDDAKYFIGGIFAHAQGICAITNPIVNSYKRLISLFEEKATLNWSENSEDTLIKVRRCFDETKVELRFPDGAANPYLALAVCIKAGLDGLENKITPESVNLKKLPNTLGQAIKYLSKDKLICDALGADLVKNYSIVKNHEWNEYIKEVSDWELDKYLVKM